MSTEPTEPFPEIDPDPEAVLAAFGIDSPHELAAADGIHEPTRDDRIDADDTTAAYLFDNLQELESESQPVAADGGGPSPSDDTDANSSDTGEPTAQAAADLEFEFVGDAAVTVRDDGAVIDETAADLRALTDTATATDAETERSAHTGPDPDATADLKLVGPEPTPTRVANERFNSADVDGR
ncbi:prolipoprotein diacylglyceryl transferase [Natronorubrum aibiense]|uniref:Uncharacterized protein n=1 Tax=Natronorubrum aibiense TaxID=348826 RepID=A0A5P9P212_9EURY|nr:hypothetical protein [Natronorubrum aibiense]QFU82171.1 hypothetical protein GCU68_06320 [Natronorubrum aibiense]